MRTELYPFALLSPPPDGFKDFGLTFQYSRAFGLHSKDIDDEIPEQDEIDTRWYHWTAGVRYRALGGDNPFSFAIAAGFQQWVYEFDPTVGRRPIASAKYTLVPMGGDARYRFGKLAAFAEGRFLLPVSVAQVGTRAPSGPKLGAHGALGLAFAVTSFLELDARATYTLVTFGLPSAPGRADRRGTVLDQYLVFGLGATLVL